MKSQLVGKNVCIDIWEMLFLCLDSTVLVSGKNQDAIYIFFNNNMFMTIFLMQASLIMNL